MVSLGLTLQPDDEYLELLGGLLRDGVDHYEVTPETLWWADDRGALHENGFHARFLALADATGRPVLGHGVGLSVGSANDSVRRRRWLRRLREDGRRFRFPWFTEHLGVSAPAGLNLTLPLPLWLDPAAERVAGRRLASLVGVAPRVGLENSVFYFSLGSAVDEATLLARLLRGPGRCLLLDVHNLYTMARNLGYDPAAYLDQLDLRQVVEIHLSGGADSDGAWLRSGRVLRLDSHDDAVPEPVWALFEAVLPRCTNLRAVTLERMEGTVQPADVPLLAEELRRARALLGRPQARRRRRPSAKPAPSPSPAPSPPHSPSPASPAAWARYEALLVRLMTAADPVAALADAQRDRRLPRGLRAALASADPDGVALSALLCARLRFERLLRGSPSAERWFDEAPAAFSAAFRAYHQAVPPTAFHPAAEARAFAAFTNRRDAA